MKLNLFNLKKQCKKIFSVMGIFALAVSFSGCAKKDSGKKSIAVFIPGIMADSPIYATLAKGVTEACDRFNEGKSEEEKCPLYVFEAGTNQAEWSGQLTSLCATGKYSVIISSNPSLPELAEPLTKQFPNQKFIFLDAMMENNMSMATVRYKQDEAAYLTGYIAGLMSKAKKIGLITAQEYPVMNNIILPGYEKGAKDACPEISVDFRIVGNWYDAKKGAELADAMASSGVDVILPICGGAGQGVIASAKENKTYLCWFDSNTFESAPGLVISCAVSLQQKLACEMTQEYLEGKTVWGSFRELGMKDGYIKFVDDDPLYEKTVPENVREKMKEQVSKIIQR